MTTIRGRLGSAPWDADVDAAAARYGIDADLIRAIIGIESSGNPDARGAAGEVGLMQVMPGTADMVGARGDLWDPAVNIDAGARYLAHQLERYGGDVAKALSAYNAGTATPRNQSYVDKVLAALWPQQFGDADPGPAPLDVSGPLDWVQAHPWLAAGIGGAIVWYFSRR